MSLAELKLRQRLLKEQMTVIDGKFEKCAALVHQRRAAKVQANSPGPEVIEQRMPRALLREAAESTLVPHRRQGLRKATAFGGAALDLRQKHLARQIEVEAERDSAARRRPREGPGKSGAYKPSSAVPETLFPIRHARAELPCAIEHVSFGLQLTWSAPLNVLDYEHYLPIFVEGLCCPHHPYDFMARQGCHELLEEAQGSPERILPSLPKILPMLRSALVTKHPSIVLAGLQFLRELAMCNYGVGEALVPYYRMLLGVVNLYVTKRRNLGDEFDYSQGKDNTENLGAVALETLECLERTGGPKAFSNIKYMVPTYQSVLAPVTRR